MTIAGTPTTVPHLPAALMKIWGAQSSASRLDAQLERLLPMPGMTVVEDGLIAFFPVAGRANVFEAALALAMRLVDGALGIVGGSGAAAGLSEDQQVLIFPGQTIHRHEDVAVVPEALLEDISRQRPMFPGGGVFLTGYARGWLRGRHSCRKVDEYLSPAGPRIPLFQWAGEEPRPCRWHNIDLLGRKLAVDRLEVREHLEDVLEHAAARVEGVLGSGKSWAVHDVLSRRDEAVVWLSLERSLPGEPLLEKCLTQALWRDWPELFASPDPTASSQMDSPELPELAQLRRLANHLDQLPRVVCDGIDGLEADDLERLGQWLAQEDAGSIARFLLVGRSGTSLPAVLQDLPTAEVPRLSPAESSLHLQTACEGLGIGEEMRNHWQDMVLGNPLALEEGVLGLYHHGRIRRVYGSYFFDGASDCDYHLSDRLIRMVEAEVRRLGEPLGLRILAASELAVPPQQIEQAVAASGIVLEENWPRPFIEGGWIEETDSPLGEAYKIASPALAKALLAPLHREAVTSLRHALGRVIVANEDGSPSNEWRAYQLLAGSPEALSPLLDLSRDSAEAASRTELFEALLTEYRLFQERGGSAKTELALLWSMLPLARRIERLHELQNELERAIQLAADIPRRKVALLTLKAELDQEKGRFRAAEEGLKQALAISEGAEEKHRLILFLRLGELLMREDRLHEAREMFTNLLSLVQGQGGELAATCHYYLGNVALNEKRFDEALEHHAEALHIRQRKEDRRLGASLSALGALHQERGDYPKAGHFFEQAEDVLSRHGGRPEELSFALRGAGRALSHLGDYLAASRPFKRALELGLNRDVLTEAFARLDIAENHLNLGHVSQALAEAREAHFRLSLISNAILLGEAEMLLGRILLRQQQEDAAKEHFEEALKIHRRLSDSQRQAVDHSWLLELALRQGDSEALLRQSQALESSLSRQPVTSDDETLVFRLFKAFDWLERRQIAVPAARPFLERAYQELMRKTAYLEPEQRHNFLFQSREHEELLAAAAKYQLTPP